MDIEQPKTLMEAIVYFADKKRAADFVAELRWPDGVTCPRCQSADLYHIATRNIWQCKSCKRQFSVKVGTIFEDSALGLDKWLAAIWMIANAKNGISSYEIHRALGITQKSAWFMLHRIRLALKQGSFDKLSGDVEVDETYIGGKASNMHEGKREVKGRGSVGKAIVVGLLERNGQVRTKVVRKAKKRTLHNLIRDNVEQGANLYTDAFKSYDGLTAEYVHQTIDHATEYVRGIVHTNGIENYWSLFKRALRGTYVNCDSEHLFRYLDEENFRFNNRGTNDGTRFVLALAGVFGRRLTYATLIASEKYKQLKLWNRFA